jgi:hypothetical protein
MTVLCLTEHGLSEEALGGIGRLVADTAGLSAGAGGKGDKLLTEHIRGSDVSPVPSSKSKFAAHACGVSSSMDLPADGT